MSRKDDPVFNVKFVQLVESHPCLWNSTLPGYSKKEEIQKAWQEVANETKDTVRNSRERWRTIRSSFLRSLKMSRTNTGRGKRKYYLSKYLQFLIPYTKTRLKSSSNIIALRKSCLPIMTRIPHQSLPTVSSDETKDSTLSEIAIAEEDVVVSLHEGTAQQPPLPLPQQLRLLPIKTEADPGTSGELRRCATNNTTTTNTGTVNGNSHLHSSSHSCVGEHPLRMGVNASAFDLTEFAEWVKSKNEAHRHCSISSSAAPDADQSFLNSLHPYLKEMSGKQNRRFRQKVVALIDAILDNAD